MSIPKGLSAVLCNQKTFSAKHQRHVHERNTRRAAKAHSGCFYCLSKLDVFPSKWLCVPKGDPSSLSSWLRSRNQNDGLTGAWAKGKDAPGQRPLPLPGHFQEQENLWNENVVTDLEGTHPQGLTVREFWTLEKPEPATENFHSKDTEGRACFCLPSDVKTSQILEC